MDPMKIDPRFGAAIICFGVVAQVGLHYLKIDQAGIGLMIVTAGVAILTGTSAHATATELVELKKSMRPPPPPPPTATERPDNTPTGR